MPLATRRRGRHSAPVEKPLRDELLSIERLEERALALAASLTVDPDPRHRARDTFPRFEDNVRVLRAAYRTLADDVRTGQFVVSAADWLLDNFHLVTAEISDIRRNLPRAVLPHAAGAGFAQSRRSCSHLCDRGRADSAQRQPAGSAAADPVPEQLPACRAADDRRAVGVAEHVEAGAHRKPAPPGRGTAVCARRPSCRRSLRIPGRRTPAALKRCPAAPTPRSSSSCCIASASTACGWYPIRLAVDEHLASRHTTAEDTIRGEHQRQGVAQVSVANAVTSLRLCATLDWQEYVEAVSLVEHVLQRDPAGAYGRMDFLSRDQQRQAVEALATPSGEGQVRVALKAIESARQAAASGSTADRAAHVGYHLIDEGAAISKRTSPIAPARRYGFVARCCAMRQSRTSAPSRWSPPF